MATKNLPGITVSPGTIRSSLIVISLMLPKAFSTFDHQMATIFPRRLRGYIMQAGLKGKKKVSQRRQEMSESDTENISWSFRNGLSGVHRFCILSTVNDGA